VEAVRGDFERLLPGPWDCFAVSLLTPIYRGNDIFIWAMGYGLWDMGYGLWAMGFKLQFYSSTIQQLERSD